MLHRRVCFPVSASASTADSAPAEDCPSEGIVTPPASQRKAQGVPRVSVSPHHAEISAIRTHGSRLRGQPPISLPKSLPAKARVAVTPGMEVIFFPFCGYSGVLLHRSLTSSNLPPSALVTQTLICFFHPETPPSSVFFPCTLFGKCPE